MTSQQKPYQGLRTFLKCQQVPTDETQFIVQGIPFDGATSNRPGARFGPSSIREASLMLTDGEHPEFRVNPTTSNAVVDIGDIVVSNSNVAQSLLEISQHIDTLSLTSPAKHLVSLGGDHTVTLGILRSLYKQHGKMAVLHFDAHCDTWSDHFGDPLGHGTWVKNAIEEGLVDPECFVSAGIRSPSDADARNYLENAGGLTLSARMVMDMTHSSVMNLIEHSLNNKNLPIYVTFDIDAIDPSMAPGTGTPEIAGLTTIKALQIMEGITGRCVGMDVVEVSPPYDSSQITSLTAATIAWTYICKHLSGK